MENKERQGKDEVQTSKQFVEELIYENIRLAEQNIRFIFENKRLREELKELKALERWWRGDGQKIGEVYLN